MKVYVQLLAAGSLETAPSCFVFFDDQRYLFNCGEGTQRFCCEHRVRLSKLRSIFLTRLTPEHVGGLAGMLLTLGDIGVTDAVIGGPPRTRSLINAFRYFVHSKYFHSLSVVEFDDVVRYESIAELPHRNQALARTLEWPTKRGIKSGSFTGFRDTNVHITPVLVYPPPPRTAGAPPVMHQHKPFVDERDDWRAPSDVVVANYICKLPDVPGKFSSEKARALGLKPGPLYGALTRGESVVTDAGVTVRPEDVISASQPGPVLLVVDCPSVEYVERLVSHPQWEPYLAGGPAHDRVACVVHLSSAESLAAPRYQQWISTFHASAKHVIANAQCNKRAIFRASELQHSLLTRINDSLFPHSPLPLEASFSKTTSATRASFMPENVFLGDSLMRVHLHPPNVRGTIDLSDTLASFPPLDQNSMEQEEQLQYQQHSLGVASIFAGHDVQVAFLGTGAALPSKYRNVSSTWIGFDDELNGALLDTGEGTLGQLYRTFGEQRADQLISKLAFVFISHMHADHHVGLCRLMTHRQKLLGGTAPPLPVLGPPFLAAYLKELEPLHRLSYTFSSNLDGSFFFANLGLRVVPVRVDHCADACGVVFRHDSGWSVVFSGDTRPCMELVSAGHGATLLIHEATFESGMTADANAKMHSTTEEAIDIAKQMDAKFVMLTHFSQRYPKIPTFDAALKNVGIAFDRMVVRFSTLDQVPAALPIIAELLQEQEAAEADDADELESTAPAAASASTSKKRKQPSGGGGGGGGTNTTTTSSQTDARAQKRRHTGPSPKPEQPA